VAGNSDAQLFVDRGGGRWETLDTAGANSGLFPLAFAPFDDGFVYGAALGGFRQYVPGFGLCPEHGVGFTVRDVVQVREGVLATGGQTCQRNTPAALLRRR
jgi:hypothetical protein